jgi:hypothetical protein
MLDKKFLWLMMFLLPVLGWSQSADRFQSLLKSAPSKHPEMATLKMTQFISDLQLRKGKMKSDEAFLRYTFRQAHRTLLKNYKAYSQFPEIFDSGTYDCLSATTLFSLVLDEFGFDYKIIETNYHIFIVVDADQKQILLESTDKINGIISDDRILQERLNSYRTNSLLSASTEEKYYYQYDLDLYQQVLPLQLIGLLYFNQAVTDFNDNDLVACAQELKKAIRIYNTPRIAEFALILVNKIADSELEEEEKKKLISPFASLIKAKAAVVASL